MNPEREIKKIFEKEINKEVFKNEIFRAKILSYFFYFLGFNFIFFPIFGKEDFIAIFSEKMPKYLPCIFFFFIGSYFFILQKIFSYFTKKENQIPFLPRYLNAFMETSIPSIVLYFLCTIRSDYPIYNLVAPPVSVYFIFIVLSGLRFSYSLSIFTGFVAGIEFFLLALYFSSKGLNSLPTDYTVSLPGFFIRSGFFILAGFITGFVTRQMEKRMIHSFSVLEERDKITSLFGQHVSPEVVEKLVKQSDFTSEVKHVSILFFDIRNFTSFSEKKNASEVVEYLNYIFNFCIEIINKNNGIINKFLGDGFMAVFGAPISNGNDVKNSTVASLEILQRIEFEVQEKNIPETNIGIGIHAGEAVTGNIGSSSRKEYTIIGDVVNLASRVEQLNKQFNSKILITEEVKKFLEEKDELNFLDEVLVKGRVEKVKIFKLA